MTIYGRLVLVCAVGMVVCGRRLPAEASQACGDGLPLRVTVRIDNNAGVPDEMLMGAKVYAAEAYTRIGVTVEWVDGAIAAREKVAAAYTVVLITPEAASRMAFEKGGNDEVVGHAVVASRRAYIHYERVRAMALSPERDLVTFLGYAMAHELGHLLLPGRGHSAAGIMRGSVPLSSRSLHTFTAVDASRIRDRLKTHRQLAQ